MNFVRAILLFSLSLVQAQGPSCTGDENLFVCEYTETLSADSSQGILFDLSPAELDQPITGDVEDYSLVVQLSFTDEMTTATQGLHILVRDPEGYISGFESSGNLGGPTNSTTGDKSTGDHSFTLCPVTEMTGLVTGSDDAVGMEFLLILTYRYAVLNLNEPQSAIAASNFLQLFMFTITEEEAAKYSIGLHMTSNQSDETMLLFTQSADYGCPSERNIGAGAIGVSMSFSSLARLTLSSSGIPSTTANPGKWYATVVLEDFDVSEVQEPTFQIELLHNSAYESGGANLAFMVLVPFAIAAIVILNVRLMARFGYGDTCQLRYSPRYIIQGKPYRYKPRSQSWRSLVRGWFLGSDPIAEVDICEGETVRKVRQKERRPFSFSWLTVIVGMAFGISTMQFIYANWAEQQESGTRDICFYNDQCYRPKESWDIPWNNVISNAGFVVLGLMFNLDIALHEKYDRARQDHSLFYALGWALVGEGFYSASYHVCPTPAIFQFDTAFMFAIASLGIIALAQTGESPNYGIKAPKFFIFFYVPLLLFNYAGVLVEGYGAGTVTITFIGEAGFYVAFILWSLLILRYLFQYFFWDKCSACGDNLAAYTCPDCASVSPKWCIACNEAKHQDQDMSHLPIPITPVRQRKTFWAFCSLCIIFYIIFLLKAFGVSPITEIPFANLMLGFLVGSLIVYLFYRLVLQTIKNYKDYEEVPFCHYRSLYLWAMFVIGLFFGAFAGSLFIAETTDKTLAPEGSRALNGPCYFFNYFDKHDIWHFFAGIAVTIVLCVILHLNPPVNRMDYNENFEEMFEIEPDVVLSRKSSKRKASVEFKEEVPGETYGSVQAGAGETALSHESSSTGLLTP